VYEASSYELHSSSLMSEVHATQYLIYYRHRSTLDDRAAFVADGHLLADPLSQQRGGGRGERETFCADNVCGESVCARVQSEVLTLPALLNQRYSLYVLYS
jgi:hypothetical protein